MGAVLGGPGVARMMGAASAGWGSEPGAGASSDGLRSVVPRHSVPRVLFIDDDPVSRTYFEQLIAGRGMRLDLAAGADEAIGFARRHQYSLVICDLMLPRLDGLAVIERVRQTQEGARYVITTGQERARATDHLAEASIDGVLWKPWDVTQTLSLLDRWLAPPVDAQPSGPVSMQIDGTVLIVEDNPGDAALLTARLEGVLTKDARIEVAESLAEALSFLSGGGGPSIILLDLSLPDTSGLEGVTRLAQLGLKAPIVVVSGSSDESLALSAVHAGAQDYLFKERLDARSLLRTMRHSIDRKGSEQRLTRVALYDQLTGAASRMLFEQRTDRAIEAARREGSKLALLFVDLDKFKDINDRFGHEIGDALLSAFAMRLSDCLGPRSLLARLGGDEFAILLEQVSGIEDANALALAITQALREPFELTGQIHTLTASIGMALFPDHGNTEKVLLRHADLDMYRVKGHRRRTSDRPLRAAVEVLRREQVAESIRPALEQGQFIPYYQPVIDLSSRRPLFIETLLRWRKPTEGLLLPEAFLPVLDETGMIIPVGRAMLFEACRQLSRFQKASRTPCGLSVNVTAVELSERFFAQKVLEILEAQGLLASSLQLEVSERVLAVESVGITESLRLLQSSGAHLCVDDFGIGTSSLTRLRKTQVEVVKIHRSIIASVDHDPESQGIVQTTLAMERSFGMRVVAQGVENAEQETAILELGCTAAQGNFYAPPMQTDAVSQWLRR